MKRTRDYSTLTPRFRREMALGELLAGLTSAPHDKAAFGAKGNLRLAEGCLSDRPAAPDIRAIQDEIAALKVKRAELTKSLALANALTPNMRRLAASIKFKPKKDN